MPLVIMTSEDTDAKTRELVEKEGRYGMAEGQIIMVMQDKVREDDCHWKRRVVVFALLLLSPSLSQTGLRIFPVFILVLRIYTRFILPSICISLCMRYTFTVSRLRSIDAKDEKNILVGVGGVLIGKGRHREHPNTEFNRLAAYVG